MSTSFICVLQIIYGVGATLEIGDRMHLKAHGSRMKSVQKTAAAGKKCAVAIQRIYARCVRAVETGIEEGAESIARAEANAKPAGSRRNTHPKNRSEELI
jgi:hypothetical protein